MMFQNSLRFSSFLKRLFEGWEFHFKTFSKTSGIICSNGLDKFNSRSTLKPLIKPVYVNFSKWVPSFNSYEILHFYADLQSVSMSGSVTGISRFRYVDSRHFLFYPSQYENSMTKAKMVIIMCLPSHLKRSWALWCHIITKSAKLLEIIIVVHNDGNQNAGDETIGLKAMFYYDRQWNFNPIVWPKKYPTNSPIIEIMPFSPWSSIFHP